MYLVIKIVIHKLSKKKIPCNGAMTRIHELNVSLMMEKSLPCYYMLCNKLFIIIKVTDKWDNDGHGTIIKKKKDHHDFQDQL